MKRRKFLSKLLGSIAALPLLAFFGNSVRSDVSDAEMEAGIRAAGSAAVNSWRSGDNLVLL